jgi:predicted glutamine amidotransferase
MCGIFGYISKSDYRDINTAKKIISILYTLSESRGKEASGLIALTDKKIEFIKEAIPASDLIKSSNFKILISSTLNKNENIAIFGHSRLVTNGVSENNINNQPISCDGIIGVHNGIITNCDELLNDNNELTKETELDTEVLFKVLSKNIKSSKFIDGFANTFKRIEGVVNVALLFKELNIAVLSTNNGSIYYSRSITNETIIFASEKHILQQCIKKCKLKNHFLIEEIKRVPPNGLLAVDLFSLNTNLLSLNNLDNQDFDISYKTRDVINLTINDDLKFNQKNFNFNKNENNVKIFDNLYSANKEKISLLKRCSKCILAETMPFIEFDEYGICNYCKFHKPHKIKGISELKKILEPTHNDFDCLVTLSGGRDSSFGIHFIKKILGLNPVAYTYDWGMVTDLARRNQMRMCGRLGVEHILVSADIRRKRDNIKKNVLAWLKNPILGMVPLFMAGDKHYFYWSNKIARQTKVKNIILCENLLEATKFKSGFCNIKPTFGTKTTYALSLRNKFEMLFYYSKNFAKNFSYLNTSLLDTFTSFLSYYVMNHNFINLFDYIEWNEEEINNLLIKEYNWETSKDSHSTWRIGDGTASFYNYIYYTMAGITENDTFRSNQVREGNITREQALKLSARDNIPQFESIKWYLNTINLDFKKCLDTINNANKLY